jgi:aminoglycoside phosphotransferase (APT) family kinase protein
MRISDARDLDALGEEFTRWLHARDPDHPAPVVAAIERPDAGLSAETLFVRVAEHGAASGSAPAAGHRSYVLRLPPTGDGLFPAYDLPGQASVQRHLAAAGIPAVVPVVEEDESWLGAPFLVMERIPGRTLRNDAPFLREGWLAEAAPDEQARLHGELLDVLGRLHRLDPGSMGWDERGLAFLRTSPNGAGPAASGGRGNGDVSDPDGLEAMLARWDTYLSWAGEGDVPAALDDALAWCRAHLPRHAPPTSVLWGDVQLGNMVIGEDLRVAAVLDFELASLGPAELDVAWFLVLHSMTVASCGGDLPGFPDRRATIAAYEARLGRRLDDLHFYEMVAAFRSGAIMVRAARLLARLGVDDTWLTKGNPVFEMIGELLAR